MNRLAGASSAYLRQHARNPVDWWPWGQPALDQAKSLDRPIFLSVGYAACHWCHVMAHESFEDLETAKLLNDSFVAIKVDREERPDVDALYMAATQLLSGHGGWPMSVFLLPDGRPFMAGTYYPRDDSPGRVGFRRLLSAMADAWAHQRDAVERQGDELEAAIEREVSFIDHLAPFTDTLDLADIRDRLGRDLLTRVDTDGGFGDAPKFPRPSYVEALSEVDDPSIADAASRTLESMSRRGLYDHLKGGFARYSVDGQWHVPHFEKMLSDQALLARVYVIADRRYHRGGQWSKVARDTLRFVLRDLRVEKGYASSLDADAGGIEGSHVTWTVDEVRRALDDAGRLSDLGRVLARWGITTRGSFEGRSIPSLTDGEPFETPRELEPALEALRRARDRRVQPGRDNKVILEWNAMLVSACIATTETEFVTPALELLASLSTTHHSDDTWWRTEDCRAHATAADIAWLLDAHVDAYEATGADVWLARAGDLCRYLLGRYWDGAVPTSRDPLAGRGLYSQSRDVTDLVARPKEIFDGATPSSHAVACRALARLALCTGDVDTLAVAQRLVELGASLMAQHPSAVPDLVAAAGFALEGIQVVVPGASNELSDHVRSLAMPRTVLISGSGSSALLLGREAGRAYVCRAGVCSMPVSDIRGLTDQLENHGL